MAGATLSTSSSSFDETLRVACPPSSSPLTTDENHMIEFTTYEPTFKLLQYRFPFSFELASPEYSVTDSVSLGNALYESQRLKQNSTYRVVDTLVSLASTHKITAAQWNLLAQEVQANRLHYTRSPPGSMETSPTSSANTSPPTGSPSTTKKKLD
eukprot:m.16874 g.16874  ORF g.16874 m.16874 type:complete len:155 (-) comp3186_c0_seq2:77-541(-)